MPYGKLHLLAHSDKHEEVHNPSLPVAVAVDPLLTAPLLSYLSESEISRNPKINGFGAG